MSAVDPEPHARKTRKGATALVILALFLATMARQVMNPLQELVKADLGLSDNQIALLQGLALTLPVVLFAFPIGRLVDRLNRARLLFGFAVLSSVGGVLSAFASSYPMIFATRGLVGLAFAGVFTAALSLISDLSDPRARGRFITMLYLGQIFGGAASFIVVGSIVDWLPKMVPAALAAMPPWRLTQLVFATVIFAGALSLLVLREPERRETGNAVKGDTRAALKELWTYRRVLFPLLVGMATINMADAASEIWSVPVLTRKFHQQPADFGTWMGLIALFAGIGGAVAGGFLSDFGQRLKGRGGVLIGAILGAAVSIPGAFFPLMPTVHTFAILLAVFLLAGACNGAAATSALTLLIPNELRGIVTAMFGTVSMLVSYAIAPLLVSIAAGGFGFGDDVSIPLATIGAITSVIGTLAFLLAMRDARRRSPVASPPLLAPRTGPREVPG